MKQFLQKFIDEATEILETFEHNILALEKKPEDTFLIESIMRCMHTLKGSGSMFGYERIVKITHKLESVYNKIQKEQLQISEKIINLTFSVSDLIMKLLKDTNKSKKVNDEYTKLTEELNEFFSNEELETEKQNKENVGLNLYYINFEPDADVEERGVNLRKIFLQLNKTGNTLIVPKNNNNKKTYHVGWEIYIATDKAEDILEEIMMFVDLECEITHISESNLLLDDEFIKIINKNRNGAKLLSPKELLDIVKNISPGDIKDKEDSMPEISSQTNSTIRVNSAKLDDLMNRVSELITLKSEIKLTSTLKGYEEIIELTEKLEQVTSTLRNDVFEIRLVTLDTIRVNLERLIRDTSVKLKKEVQFTTEGLNTELDKTIVDKLLSPLMHIIRNSIDHGIEDTVTRSKRNKTAHGNIKIKAYRSGSYVYVEVSDDGAGIDKKMILDKAIQKKIIKKNSKLSDKEIFNLIFASGLSTAVNLSSVSGRGVGMDVVKSEITKLRGDIEIHSEKEVGTTVIFKLPLSLSIIDTLLVQTGEMFFSIPIEEIDRCEITKMHNFNVSGSNFLRLNHELIPYIYLRKIFNVNNKFNKSEKAIIINREGKNTAIIVDKIIGEFQAVVKPLGKSLEEKEFLSGGSLMPNGNISYIIDTNKLVETYNN